MIEEKYFNDLSSYCFGISPYVFKDILNVGWIDISRNFERGEVPAFYLNKIRAIVRRKGVFRPLVGTNRKLPECDICGELRMPCPDGGFLPEAELWLPGRDVWYAAPITILHYIAEHAYRPPEEYLAAIDLVDPTSAFIGDELYDEKLEESGWVYVDGSAE